MIGAAPRIAYVHTGFWPSASPSTVFITGTAWGLGHQHPCIFIVKDGSAEHAEQIFRSITGRELPPEVSFHRIFCGPRHHTPFYLKAYRKLSAMAGRGELAAVITRSIGFLPYLAFFRSRFAIPCLFETHDFYGDLSLRSDLKRSWENFKRSQLEKQCLSRLDGIICLTEPQRELFLSNYPGVRSVVAPTGLFSVERNLRDRGHTLCYIGSLDPHKGLGTVLEALRLTAAKDTTLLIIGGKTGAEKQSILDYARSLGVEDRVRVTLWVNHAEVGKMVDSCIAGLVPLRDTFFNRRLTSPLKILDYFSRCTPVIASDLPSVRYYVKDGAHGFLFQPDNPQDLARAIDRYIDGNHFEEFSGNILRDAPKLLWTERGKIIGEFVDSISLPRSPSLSKNPPTKVHDG